MDEHLASCETSRFCVAFICVENDVKTAIKKSKKFKLTVEKERLIERD